MHGIPCDSRQAHEKFNAADPGPDYELAWRREPMPVGSLDSPVRVAVGLQRLTVPMCR